MWEELHTNTDFSHTSGDLLFVGQFLLTFAADADVLLTRLLKPDDHCCFQAPACLLAAILPLFSNFFLLSCQ